MLRYQLVVSTASIGKEANLANKGNSSFKGFSKNAVALHPDS